MGWHVPCDARTFVHDDDVSSRTASMGWHVLHGARPLTTGPTSHTTSSKTPKATR